MAAIVALAFILRWVDLDGFSPNVDGDEAVTGINARQLLYGLNTNWLGTDWMGFPSPSFLAHSFSMSLFGDNLHGLRMASVVSGVAAVITSYLLISLLFGRSFGLLTALLMATSQLTIHFSRIGLNNIQAIPVTTLALYFFCGRYGMEGGWTSH